MRRHTHAVSVLILLAFAAAECLATDRDAAVAIRSLDWVFDYSSGPFVLSIRSFCRQGPHGFEWLPQLQGTRRLEIAYKAKKIEMGGQEIVSLAPIPVKDCAKPVGFKFDVREPGQTEHYAYEYREGKVTSKLKQPRQFWSSLALATAEAGGAYLGSTIGGGNKNTAPIPIPPTTTEQTTRTTATQTSSGPVQSPSQPTARASSSPSVQPQQSPPPRPPLNTSVGNVTNGNPYHMSDSCSVGAGAPIGATIWYQDFEYVILANQSAELTVQVTFSNGSSYTDTLQVLSGSRSFNHTQRLGCDYWAPPSLSIQSVHILSGRPM